MGALAPGGLLAVQMPSNFASPSHRLVHDVGVGWTMAREGAGGLQCPQAIRMMPESTGVNRSATSGS